MKVGQSASNDGFGRYLASVAERDIDLLLLEEFHASKKFVKWFCREIGLYGISPADAWHSVSDTDGESDLLVRVLRDEQRIGILIENKIAAPEQDRQAERYHIRGIKCREQGKLDSYVTVMCAPKLRACNKTPIGSRRVARSHTPVVADDGVKRKLLGPLGLCARMAAGWRGR